MAVLEHGKSRSTGQKLGAASLRDIFEAVHSLQHVPAVVFSSGARCGLKVNLFPGILTNIGDEKITCDPVKSAAPGIADAVCPDLLQCVRVAHEWVIRWHGVVAIRVAGEIIAVNVHTQNLAQPGLEILSVLLRITAAAAVTQGNVQVAIGAKCELPAVVIRKRLRLTQNREHRVWIRNVWVVFGNRVAGDLRIAVYVRVIDVEESIVSVIRVESETEQALLAATTHQFMDIQERCGKHCAVN